MSFQVRDPEVYQEQYIDGGESPEYKAFCAKHRLQVIKQQRVNESDKFSILISFEDLNLLVEGLIVFRETMWDSKVMGEKSLPKFHIIDPNFCDYNAKVPEILNLLDKTLVELHSLLKDIPNIKERLFKNEMDSIFHDMVDKREKSVNETIENVNLALWMLKDDEKTSSKVLN